MVFGVAGALAATYALDGFTGDLAHAVRSTLTGRTPAADSDGILVLSSHEPSVCCQPFIDGLRLVAIAGWIGGVPLAIAALVLRYRFGRARTAAARVFARLGFALQIFSIGLWTMMFVLLMTSPSDVIVEFDVPRGIVAVTACALWLGHTLMGVLGARAWWRLADSGPALTPLF